MQSPERASSEVETTKTASRGSGAEAGRITNAPPRKARRLDDKTYIQLSLVLTLLLPLIGILFSAGFEVGKFKDNADNRGERQRLTESNKQLIEGLGSVIVSLDNADTKVDDLLKSMKPGHADSELSIYLNERGFNIYKAAKARANDHANSFSRQEIQRALKWFSKAQDLDGFDPFPRWNSACMFGLLLNVDGAKQELEDLRRVVPPGHKAEFEVRVSSDTDLCPIEKDSAFSSYLQSEWNIQRQAQCPNPPISTQ
jgi:hypothetical protein